MSNFHWKLYAPMLLLEFFNEIPVGGVAFSRVHKLHKRQT